MAEKQIKLSGAPAVLVIIAIAAFGLFRFNSMRKTLSTEAADELKHWLVARYSSQALAEVETQKRLLGAQSVTSEQYENVLKSTRVEITNISARGGGDDIVVRVDISVDGNPPPDGKTTRYYRMEHSLATGWHMKHEVSKLSYLLKLF